MYCRRLLVSAAFALGLSLGAQAQTAKARATAGVDLAARFAQAEADPQLAQTLLTTGRKVAAVCANCHGEGGNSAKPSIPNLAGQNPAYLLERSCASLPTGAGATCLWKASSVPWKATRRSA